MDGRRQESRRPESTNWGVRQRAQELEKIAGVHVRIKPFDLDDIAVLIAELLPATERT